MNESKQAMLELLPEIDDERRMFDRLAAITGGPLLAIPNSLHVQRGIFSIPGASFYEQATIHYNEILKANAELAALRASAPQEDGRALEPLDGEGGLASTFARYASRFTDSKQTIEVTLSVKEVQQIAAALSAPPSVALEAGRVDRHMLAARALVEAHITDYGMVPHPDKLKEAIAAALTRPQPGGAVAGTERAPTENIGE